MQFLSVSYGQKKPGRPGTPIQLLDGQRMTVTMPMFRMSAISGLVIGEDGEPVMYATVQVYRYDMSSGVRRAQPAGGGQTDDRGQYRIYGLQPGEYVVAATANSSMLAQVERVQAERAAFTAAVAAAARSGGSGRSGSVSVTMPVPGNLDSPAGYAPTFYPGTTMLASASTITLGPSDERNGVDIQVQMVRAANIRGTVDIPTGLAAAVQISLSNADSTMPTGVSGARANPDGTFLLRNIPPGRYTVFAQTVPPPPQPVAAGARGVATPPPAPPRLADADRLWGRAEVVVDGQATPAVSLQLERGRSISGRVLFDMTRPVDLTRSEVLVTLSPASSIDQVPQFGPNPQGKVGADARFAIDGLIPGKYVVRTSYAAAKSVMVGGQDAMDIPLEVTGREDIGNVIITVSDKLSEVSGRLTEANGQAGSDYTVVIATDDQRLWIPGSRRVLTTRPDSDGQFVFRGLPPGGYHLAAVTDVEPGGQYDSTFLRSLSGASVRVTLTDGGRVSQDLRVTTR